MNNFWTGVVTIITAIIGVAVLATLVSKRANTAEVLTSGGDAISSMLRAATSPLGGSYY